MTTAVTPLRPGRYVVRGGPRGETSIQPAMRPVEFTSSSGRCLRRGVTVVPPASYHWLALATFKVRPGQCVTHYGALDAVMRVWNYGGTR